MVRPVALRIAGILPIGTVRRRLVLGRMWKRKSSEMLDAYLVSGYQNPRINVQSILVRHFLIRRLFGDEFEAVMDEELRFAVERNETLRRAALDLGVTMGAFINPERYANVRRVDASIEGRDTVFVERWVGLLGGREAERLQVLEFACGSANDYRAFVEYGLGQFLDYRGVDLTAKNIENARRRFPGVEFVVGDVVSLPYPDGAFDCVIASDLFEHLAIKDMERALDAASRLARRALCLSFFSMADRPDHAVRPKASYYVNTLSRSRVEERLRVRYPAITATPIATMLADRFDYRHTYNPKAWTLVAERAPTDR
jgi:SAM-dependent methyltransferase